MCPYQSSLLLFPSKTSERGSDPVELRNKCPTERHGVGDAVSNAHITNAEWRILGETRGAIPTSSDSADRFLI